MKRLYVADLEPGMNVISSFVVTDKYLGRQSPHGRTPNKPFLRLTLADRTGRIGAVMWEKADEYAALFSAGDIIKITGRVSEWNSRLQLEIDSLRRCEDGEADPSHFIRQSQRDRAEMEAEMDLVVESVANPHLRALLSCLFDDPEFRNRYVIATAAVTVHHAYAGGLMEHSLEVVKWVELAASMHPGYANRDLLVTGALLHDVGKLDSYLVDGTRFDMTLEGKLYGHLLLGWKVVRECISRIDRFPESLAQELLHIIASHHGERDYGAIEPPRTFNAFCVHWADMASSRIHQFAGLLDSHADPERLWTRRDGYLGTEAYLGFLRGEDVEDGRA